MDKKQSADRMWDRVLANLEKGIIDAGLLGSAMHMCNLADKAIMEYENQTRGAGASRL